MKKNRKKFAALLVAFAMVFSVVGTALAADEEVMNVYKNHAPTDVTTKNFQYLSGATAAANTPVLSILGINVTSTDAAGALNAASDATAPLNLLIFGSELNENPDPYLWNFYYNLAADDFVLPAEQYDSTSYKDWDGAYTLLNYAKSGPTGGANNTTTIPINVDGKSKVCNPVFFYKPDVLLGSTTSSYDTGLKQFIEDMTIIAKTKDETLPDDYVYEYNPLQIGGWGTGSDQYALNNGTFESTVAMANGVYKDAVTIYDTYDSLKVGRYGSVVDCGVVYSSFGLGLYYYAQSLFETKVLTPLRYCATVSIEGSQVTLESTSARVGQYLDGLGTEVTGTYSLNEVSKYVDVVLTSDGDVGDALKEAGVTVYDSTMPETAYGTLANAPDNILGPGYMFALLYSDQLAAKKIYLTKDDVTAYFVDNIYHVNSGDDVQTVVNTMYGIDEGEGDVPINTNYNSIIDEMIVEGASYYLENFEDSGNWLSVFDDDFWVIFSDENE